MLKFAASEPIIPPAKIEPFKFSFLLLFNSSWPNIFASVKVSFGLYGILYSDCIFFCIGPLLIPPSPGFPNKDSASSSALTFEPSSVDTPFLNLDISILFIAGDFAAASANIPKVPVSSAFSAILPRVLDKLACVVRFSCFLLYFVMITLIIETIINNTKNTPTNIIIPIPKLLTVLYFKVLVVLFGLFI